MPRMIHVLVFAAALVSATAASAAPQADLWPYWQKHEASSEATIDHAPWTRFLDEYRQLSDDGVSLIDYGAVTDADRQKLQDYIERLAGIAIRDYSRPVQFAYWVNLYNAVTVEVVLEHYPVDSIRDIDISSGWFSAGPWGAELVEVEGKALTLNDIEHRILRPIWQDPRIHYAVNCASIGCPNLAATAYTAENSERLLDNGARQYVNHPRGAAIEGGELIVSSIYEWYQADFDASEQGVVEHLRKYADDAEAKKLEGRSGYANHRYNWSLNDVP